MNILFIGDIMGRPGRHVVQEYLPTLRQNYVFDLIIANAENSAGGHGINMKTYTELSACGVQVFTMGNHTWADKEMFNFVKNKADAPVIRPANFPPGNIGQGYYLWPLPAPQKGYLAVVNLIGRAMMKHDFDCPFRAIDGLLSNELNRPDIHGVIVDFHAEATSEKIAMKHYLDGRVMAILGTHTHVPTKDLEISEKGTLYVTDVGMTGPYNSVIGMKVEPILERFLKQISTGFEVASGPAVFQGIYFRCLEGKVQEAEHLTFKQLA